MADSGAVAGLCPITEANLGDGIFDARALSRRPAAASASAPIPTCSSAPGELASSNTPAPQAPRPQCAGAGARASTGRRSTTRRWPAARRRSGRRRRRHRRRAQRADLVSLDASHPDSLPARGDAGSTPHLRRRQGRHRRFVAGESWSKGGTARPRREADPRLRR